MPASRQDLVEALEGTARGDLAAFKTVYAATCVKLYGIVIRILQRPDLADEVLQEVYVRVWQRAGDFDPASSSPVTWLASIARNRALDEIRRGTMRSLEDHPELLQVPSDDDPSTNLERNEQLRRLDACLEGLEPEKKEIVLLAYYYGLTREEISNRFGRPVPTVKTWLRRSLAQLKDCLARGSVRDDPLVQQGDASCGRLTAGMRPPAMPRPEAAAYRKQAQSPATQKPPPSSGTSSST